MIDTADIIMDADKAAAELCKRKLSFFVKEFWNEIIEDDMEWAPHMDILCDEVQKVYERVFLRQDPKTKAWYRLPKLYDLIINIPPGTSKSTIVTIMAPAWGWTRDPSLRFITGSFAESLSTSHAVNSRDIIRSAKYQRYFPHVQIKKDQDNKTDYRTTRRGQRYVTSTGASPTGVHAHIQIMDDLLNPKEAVSEKKLKASIHFVSQTLPTRKADKRVTPLILIMQRLHTDDPTGYLLKKRPSTIRHICLPGTLSNNVKPAEYRSIYKAGLLDSRRLPQSALNDLKIELGSYGYAGQIDQVPTPEGGLLWKKWFIEVDDAIFPPLSSMTGVGTDWDLAYTADEENSGSAHITSGDLNGKMFIDSLGAVYMEFPELIAFMRIMKSPHYIEAKGPGKSAKPTLVKMKIPAIEVKVEGGKDKVARAKMASPYAEAGMVYIRKSLADFLYNDSRQGILNFPKGSHTDIADTLAQAIQRHFKGKMITGNANEKSVLDYLKE